jgi:general transcriptional corepressor trfA
MVLIVNATKKYKSPSSSNNDITQIIDSIRIARDSNSLRDYNNNNNSNNNNNNNYNRNGSLSYNFKYPNGWNQEK